jgi:hypothetical protein
MKKKLATAVLITGLGLMGCVMNAPVNTTVSAVKFSGVKVTSSATSRLSETELAAISRDLEAGLIGASRLDPKAQEVLTVEITKLAFRPGGTTQTLRQMGGRDSIRSVVSVGGAHSQEVVAHLRSEGFEKISADVRKHDLSKALATNIVAALR